MTVHRTLAAGALATTLVSGLIVAAPTTAVAGGTGKADIHLVDPTGNPVKGFTLCPTKKSAPKVGKKEGKCGTTNKKGHATLKDVKPGHWFVTIYASGMPTGSFSQKIKIVAGKTTKAKIVVAG